MNENNKKPNEAVKDSGKMQSFESGSRRDDSSSKGDCSLLPLQFVAQCMDNDPVLIAVGKFMEERTINHLADAIRASTKTVPRFQYEAMVKEMQEEGIEMHIFDSSDSHARQQAELAHMMIEVSKLFQDGAKKYGRARCD